MLVMMPLLASVPHSLCMFSLFQFPFSHSSSAGMPFGNVWLRKKRRNGLREKDEANIFRRWHHHSLSGEAIHNSLFRLFPELILIFFSFADRSRHVCSHEETVSRPVRVVESYCKPAYKSFSQRCANGTLCTAFRFIGSTRLVPASHLTRLLSCDWFLECNTTRFTGRPLNIKWWRSVNTPAVPAGLTRRSPITAARNVCLGNIEFTLDQNKD